MDVTFWGVRGSIPCCGEDYKRSGGCSSCVSVLINETLIIFDAGTGIRDLGIWLDGHPHIKEAHLFLSHAHYDHIIGFPFFKPLWNPDFKLTVYSTVLGKHGGTESFFKKRVFADPFFPVNVDQLQCHLSFQDCHDGEEIALKKITDNALISSSGIKGQEDISPVNVPMSVLIEKLNHPGGASGFRLNYGAQSVAYVSDTEHTEGPPDPPILTLVQKASLVIYDATFTDAEYPRFKGWGHSTWQEGMKLCQQAGAQRMAIYHHDPSHTDDIIDQIEHEATQAWSGLFVARQGLTVSVES